MTAFGAMRHNVLTGGIGMLNQMINLGFPQELMEELVAQPSNLRYTAEFGWSLVDNAKFEEHRRTVLTLYTKRRTYVDVLGIQLALIKVDAVNACLEVAVRKPSVTVRICTAGWEPLVPGYMIRWIGSDYDKHWFRVGRLPADEGAERKEQSS